jgi:hypothetical protein
VPPLPQLHPPLRQRSVLVPLHGVQAPPLVPQSLKSTMWQALPTQQPFGHDDALHTQTPPTQSWVELH